MKPTILNDMVSGYDYQILTDKDTNRKLYFSTENFTVDDKNIIFKRTKENCDELIRMNIESYEEVVLVSSLDGWHIPSFGMDRNKNEGYLEKDNIIYRLNVQNGTTYKLAPTIENSTSAGHYTASKSGILPMIRKLDNGIYCLAITYPEDGITKTMFHTDTRLGHCQACPGDDDTIFYCHETGGDALQRMWHYSIKENRSFPYFVERWGDWITHETWSHDGSYMTFIRSPQEIWVGQKDGRNFKMIASSHHYHHCAPSINGKWITADRSFFGDAEIVLINVETGMETVLVNGYRPEIGIDHQHPSFNRKGDKVLFSAPMKDGTCHVGIIDLKQIDGFTI